MQNVTPPTMTIQEFNDKVKSWTLRTRSRMASNAPKRSGNLAQSVSHSFKMNFGHVSIINFKFDRHGVFVHYGVGRGYIRQGNAVIRGTRNGGKVDTSTGFNRHPDDWFDVEIRTGLNDVANITQEYYGDYAMNEILSKMNKFLIQRK